MEHHRDKISHPAMMVPTTTTTTGSTAAREFSTTTTARCRCSRRRRVVCRALRRLCRARQRRRNARGDGGCRRERDESVVEYNSDLAKAHGTDAPGIFSGGGLVDKAKEFNEGTWARLRSDCFEAGREKIVGDDGKRSIDGLCICGGSGGRRTRTRTRTRGTKTKTL